MKAAAVASLVVLAGCSLGPSGDDFLDGRSLAITSVWPDTVTEGEVGVTILIEADGLSKEATLRAEVVGSDAEVVSLRDGTVGFVPGGTIAETFDMPVLTDLGRGDGAELKLTISQVVDGGELVSTSVTVPLETLDELDCDGCDLSDLQPLYSRVRLRGTQACPRPPPPTHETDPVFCNLGTEPLRLEATDSIDIESTILFGTRIEDVRWPVSSPCPGGDSGQDGNCASGGRGGVDAGPLDPGVSGGGGSNVSVGLSGSGGEAGNIVSAAGEPQGTGWLVDPSRGFGGGGGGGSASGNGATLGGRGGDGGGVVLLKAAHIRLLASLPSISVAGGHGRLGHATKEACEFSAEEERAGQGGGGAGGAVFIQARRSLEVSQSGRIQADGGIGGLAGDGAIGCKGAGNGAGGEVRIDTPAIFGPMPVAPTTLGPFNPTICSLGKCDEARAPSVSRGPSLIDYRAVISAVPIVVQIVGEPGAPFRIELDGEFFGTARPNPTSVAILDVSPGRHELCVIIDAFESSTETARVCRPLVFLPSGQ